MVFITFLIKQPKLSAWDKSLCMTERDPMYWPSLISTLPWLWRNVLQDQSVFLDFMPSPQAGHLPDVTSVLPHLLKTYSHLWLLGMKHLLVGQLFTRYLNYLILQDSLAESYLLEAHLSLPAILWAPAINFTLSEHLLSVWSLSVCFFTTKYTFLTER